MKCMRSVSTFVFFVALVTFFGTGPAMAGAPSAETAKQSLEASTRHGEYLQLDLPGSETKLRTWISFPERPDKAPVIIVIHEIFGLSEWITSVADAFAAEGFIALAPDLISGMEGAEENPRETIGKLSEEEAVKRLNVVADYALALPAASGKLGVVGYCWGGKTSFMYAGVQSRLSAAVVYYGTSPEAGKYETITCPVLGLYGEDDARVNATIPTAQEEMKKLNKTYEVEIYEGAGHGFLRQQDAKEGANKAAAEKAWTRTVEFFKKYTE
ncbi:MAG: hypothetical protein AMXMBFR84_15410 [Candidatus Hydrogenedentota bacterium]